MAKDVVQRLRDIQPYWPTHEALVVDAADEIERLRAALSVILLNYGALLHLHGADDQRSIQKARAALGITPTPK